MSAQSKLPPELTEVEGLLKTLSPASSTVDRDALMYQAGWAAAEANARRATGWLWPATSAALAASLAFALAFPPTNPSPPASPIQQAATPSATHAVAATSKSTVPLPTTTPLPVRRSTPPRWNADSASLLAMRDRALRLDFDEVPLAAAPVEAPVSQSTNQSLLEELLPESRRSATPNSGSRRWWLLFVPGESA